MIHKEISGGRYAVQEIGSSKQLNLSVIGGEAHMKPILAILVLTISLSLDVRAQDVRSKVGPPSANSGSNIIDPEKSVYGAQWDCTEDEFISKFGDPTGYIRLNDSETVMLYGKEQAFIFTSAKLSGVRITYSVFDGKLSQAQQTRTPFDAINWQLSNGVRKDMNLAEVKKILGDSLKSLRSQTYYYISNKTRIEFDFAYFPREGDKDEAYKIHGLYIRQATSVSAAMAPVSGPPESPIRQATRSCTAEVAAWWQAVRTAAKEIIDAKRRENQAQTAWYYAHPPGSRTNQEHGLPKKEFDKLEADIATAVEKYGQALAEGQAKSYRAPIEDSARPLILYVGTPRYTEEARKNKVQGKVNMQAEFRSDGKIGEVKVVSELKDGLDEQAIKATRETLFLPGVKDGMFVTIWTPLSVEFNLR
jgi:TonB family protein